MDKMKFNDSLIKNDIEKAAKERSHQELVHWAADCAEHVLHLFEDTYPNDKRPRNAILAARAWAEGEITMGYARKMAFASHAASRAVFDISAVAAARSAGHAAATAHVGMHSVHAATYAAKAASYAAYNNASENKNEALTKAAEAERSWQFQQLQENNAK